MRSIQDQAGQAIQPQDVARWLTFTGFWGFISYLLACASLLGAQRRQPSRLNARTAALGMGLHVGSFVLLGSLGSAIFALARGKSTTEIAEERISSGDLERRKALRGLLSGVGSLGLLGWAWASLLLAGRATGKPAFADSAIRWPQAMGTMALGSGVVALAVTRIVAWVARDAQQG